MSENPLSLDEWRSFWIARGQPWRTEPEISERHDAASCGGQAEIHEHGRLCTIASLDRAAQDAVRGRLYALVDLLDLCRAKLAPEAGE